MRDRGLIKLAEEYCTHYHQGQFRKGNNLPYDTHPFEVREILRRHGYRDEVYECVCLLHDVVEDTSVITGEIKETFGYEITNGVYILSKNTIREDIRNDVFRALSINPEHYSMDQLYKLRLAFARERWKRIKIGDMIHNTQDLSQLKPEGRERKINDANDFYIPMGQEVCEIMVKRLEENISNFEKKIAS